MTNMEFYKECILPSRKGTFYFADGLTGRTIFNSPSKLDSMITREEFDICIHQLSNPGKPLPPHLPLHQRIVAPTPSAHEKYCAEKSLIERWVRVS